MDTVLYRTVRFSYSQAILLGTAGWFASLLSTPEALAQNSITPDATLGTEASVVTPVGPGALPDGSDRIDGGAVRGQNLFHSFEQFNVGEGGGVYFIIPSAEVSNIFTRITGSGPSQISGILGIRQVDFSTPSSSLFFINPNGIIFGDRSSLDLGGSFLATTANAIGFANDDIFSASEPTLPSELLNVSPSALFFNYAQNAAINNRSRSPAGFNSSGSSLLGLRVPDGQNLVLIGGDINIDGGGLVSLGGKIEVGGLNNSGTIGFSIEQDQYQLSFPEASLKGNIFLDNSAGINVMAAGGGQIIVNANNLSVLGSSSIYAGIESNLGSPNIQAGDIIISVDEDFVLRGRGSEVYNYIDVNASGLGGDVIISTRQLSLEDAAQVGTLVFGNGESGDVKISASGNISLDGSIQETNTRFFPSAIYNRILTNGGGSSGNVEIEADSLNVTNRAQIASTTQGTGNAGDILITVQDQIFFLNSIIISDVSEGEGVGNGGDIIITAGFLDLVNGSALLADAESIGDSGDIFIRSRDGIFLRGLGPSALNTNLIVPSQISATVEQQAVGEGGDIKIETALLSLTDTAFISTSTSGQGSAGNISIYVNSLNITDGATLRAFTRSGGNAGSISVRADETVEINGQGNSRTGITSASLGEAQGNGGNISIIAPNLQISGQGRISAISEGIGRAGDIEFIIERFQLIDSIVATSAVQASGGNIFLNTANAASSGTTVLRGDGDINTSSFGNGGNIFLNSIVIAFDDSDILARSTDARGGNITLGPFFSDMLPLGAISPTENNGRVDVSADGRLASGTISTPDTSLVQNSLNQLPAIIVDPSALIAGSCIARADEGWGVFVTTGSGGVPSQPGDGSLSTYPTGDVQSPPSAEPQAVWQPGDPIVEPTGAFTLPDGRLVLSRRCGEE